MDHDDEPLKEIHERLRPENSGKSRSLLVARFF